MNKLFKLIYVNLLNLFDINKIIIARSDGVKSNLEKRAIITGIIALVYGIIIYNAFKLLNLDNNYYILSIGYAISSFMCFVMNLFTIEPLIFKSEDNDILFSYPISRHQILFSKLFNNYLKNMFIVGIIMIACFISFYEHNAVVTDTQLIMGILSALVIPLVPMVLATIVAYVNDYFKLKNNNSMYYKLVKVLVIILIFLLICLAFTGVQISNLNDGIRSINERLIYIYPMINIFYKAIKLESMLCFIILMVVPIIIIYIYTIVITNNYLKICSMLKGVKKKENFIYKKCNNYGKLGGLVKKEFIYLFNNRGYLIGSFSMAIIASIILFILLNFINIKELKSIDNLEIYFNLYVPAILAMFSTFGCSTISAMSLEKDNMQILRTMPVGMGSILLSKWLVNFIIGSVFVIINASMTCYYINFDVWNIVFSYVIPLIAVMFISLSGLLLDYRFIEKNETNDNYIIKQRFVTMIPSFLSILLGAIILIFPPLLRYGLALGCYILILIIFIVIELIYLLVQRKKLLEGLFN